MAASDQLALWDYRRRVAEMYQEVRRVGRGESAWAAWRTARDGLFSGHPQSPLGDADRRGFFGLRYFPYDPDWRFAVVVRPLDEDDRTLIRHSGPGETAFHRFGKAQMEIAGRVTSLTFYWLGGYGGGVFVPFGDLTNEKETYRGGRYLLDSAKGADLGSHGRQVILDFNYAFHPSCVYSDRWSCPLAPAENRLPVAVRAGERL